MTPLIQVIKQELLTLFLLTFSYGNEIYHCEDFIGNTISPSNLQNGGYSLTDFRGLRMGALINDPEVNIHANKFLIHNYQFYYKTIVILLIIITILIKV